MEPRRIADRHRWRGQIPNPSVGHRAWRGDRNPRRRVTQEPSRVLISAPMVDTSHPAHATGRFASGISHKTTSTGSLTVTRARSTSRGSARTAPISRSPAPTRGSVCGTSIPPLDLVPPQATPKRPTGQRSAPTAPSSRPRARTRPFGSGTWTPARSSG